MENREVKQGQMENTLKEWGAKIDSLKAEADKVGEDAQADLHKKIEYLEGKKAEMEANLQKLKESSDDAWESVVTGFKGAWEELGGAFEEAASKFK
ncbi:MAG: sll1863 family stress response protein [Cyanobacterium sp.]